MSPGYRLPGTSKPTPRSMSPLSYANCLSLRRLGRRSSQRLPALLFPVDWRTDAVGLALRPIILRAACAIHCDSAISRAPRELFVVGHSTHRCISGCTYKTLTITSAVFASLGKSARRAIAAFAYGISFCGTAFGNTLAYDSIKCVAHRNFALFAASVATL